MLRESWQLTFIHTNLESNKVTYKGFFCSSKSHDMYSGVARQEAGREHEDGVFVNFVLFLHTNTRLALGSGHDPSFRIVFFCGATAQIGTRPPHFWGFTSHTTRYTHTHTRYDSTGRVISSSQRPLPTQSTTNTRDEHPYPHWDLNPRHQHSCGCRPTP
jgi:IS4 transposase